MTKIYPKLAQILDQNAKSHTFDNYDVIWEDDAIEETELIHKLITDFDFIDANNATQKTLQKMKESEKDAGGDFGGGDNYDDDFDDDFAEYKQETKKP